MTAIKPTEKAPCRFCGAAPVYSYAESGLLGRITMIKCTQCENDTGLSCRSDAQALKKWNEENTIENQEDPYNVFHHDLWGRGYDDWLSDRELSDVIEYLEDEDGEYIVCGGDTYEKHFSLVINDRHDAEELLNDFAESGLSANGYFHNHTSYMEEQYAEHIGVDYDHCDPYELEKKTAKTICNLLERSAKGYKRYYEAEDEAAIKRFSNKLLRRFKRATRKLPSQSFGHLAAYQSYLVIIKNGELVNIRKNND